MANFYGDLANQIGSDDESQISDVDPSQLAKMVEVRSLSTISADQICRKCVKINILFLCIWRSVTCYQ
jgi:hypothetical protein